MHLDSIDPPLAIVTSVLVVVSLLVFYVSYLVLSNDKKNKKKAVKGTFGADAVSLKKMKKLKTKVVKKKNGDLAIAKLLDIEPEDDMPAQDKVVAEEAPRSSKPRSMCPMMFPANLKLTESQDEVDVKYVNLEETKDGGEVSETVEGVEEIVRGERQEEEAEGREEQTTVTADAERITTKRPAVNATRINPTYEERFLRQPCDKETAEMMLSAYKMAQKKHWKKEMSHFNEGNTELEADVRQEQLNSIYDLMKTRWNETTEEEWDMQRKLYGL